MKEAVLQIYNNRSNLANTLKDTRTIVGKLERLLGICLQLIFIFLYLAIFNVCPDRHTHHPHTAILCMTERPNFCILEPFSGSAFTSAHHTSPECMKASPYQVAPAAITQQC